MTGRATKGFSLADQFKILEIKFKFPWERNGHNIAESRTFLYRNKIIHLSAWIPNRICKRRDHAVSFEAFASGATRVKARRLRDRNPFTQRVVRQSLLMFDYNSNAGVVELVSSTHLELSTGCSSEPLQFARYHLRPQSYPNPHNPSCRWSPTVFSASPFQCSKQTVKVTEKLGRPSTCSDRPFLLLSVARTPRCGRFAGIQAIPRYQRTDNPWGSRLLPPATSPSSSSS